jgi:hypothetical protein
LKGSNATSARAKTAPRTARSSVRRRSTPTSAEGFDGFALAGPSNPPDPDFHAFRKDLADVALAGRVIASHYVEPVQRAIVIPAVLRSRPADDSDAIGEIGPGDPFLLLDVSLGWAWGYAGETRRVAYLRSEALG